MNAFAMFQRCAEAQWRALPQAERLLDLDVQWARAMRHSCYVAYVDIYVQSHAEVTIGGMPILGLKVDVAEEMR